MNRTDKPRSNFARLRDAIDRGRTGSKVPASDPAAAPLGTDDEAGGAQTDPALIHEVERRETRNPSAHRDEDFENAALPAGRRR